MPITAKIDEYGMGAWIALMVLAFVVFWPLGLAILAFLLWSGRMGCWRYRGMDRWQQKIERMQEKVDRFRAHMEGAGAGARSGWNHPSSGNKAFDEYRMETLRRLEEEQREFREFLDRLRMAKDKTEFDQFMAERRGRSTPPAPQPSV